MNEPIQSDPAASLPGPSETVYEPEASGRAVASLVFGILGIVGVTPCLGPILAIVLGRGERSSVGRTGVLLGWITLVLHVILACVGLAFLAFGLLVAGAN